MLITIPPRHTKTLLASVAFPAWLWCQEPDQDYPLLGPQAKFLCLSYSDRLAMDNATLAHRLVVSEWYQKRWGHRVKIARDQEAKEKFDTTAGGTRISASFGGSVLGRGGDIKILDDPHKVDEAESEVTRQSVLRTYDGTLKSRITDPRTSAEVIIMQRLHEDDLAGHVINNDEDFVVLRLPAEFESNRSCVTVPLLHTEEFADKAWEDPRQDDGELLWPQRFTKEKLAEFKRNPFEWAGQWQQMPVPRGGSILKADWWQYWDAETANRCGLEWNEEKGATKNLPPCDFVVASLDTAYDIKKENDYSALTVWGSFLLPLDPEHMKYAITFTPQGKVQTPIPGQAVRRWMLLYAWQSKLEFHDLLERVAKDCKRYHVSQLLVEAKASGKSIVQEMRRAYARNEFSVIEINPGNLDKVARAHSIVHMFTDKMIWVPNPNQIDWAYMVVDECSKFPKGTHDDVVDSVTQALNWLRLHGLADRKEEYAAELEETTKYRKRPEPLYPGS
ncbi:MAG TPA: phage terminase large subunit [Bryobacteraceae bacterium]|nr:phage terminase large subunit [Bryobacteraceae bacterium]